MSRPIRVLNVAEKPSVAKSVAGILSRGNMRVRNGRSVYNKIFEFAYTIGGQQCDMAMTSVTGHLMELDFEDQYRKWHSCDPVDLFQAPVRKRVPQVWQILNYCLFCFSCCCKNLRQGC
jgi:DNA topoisomerase-3